MKNKYTEPNYNKYESPFIIRLEAVILKDGYDSVKSFVRHQLNEGKNFREIQSFIEEKYNLKVHWATIQRNLRHLAQPNYNRKTAGHYKRRAIVRRQGDDSVTHFIKARLKEGFTIKKLARIFKISHPENIYNLEKIYPIKFDGSQNQDKVNMGFKSQAAYRRWLLIARKLGFNSVTEAVRYLFVDKGLSLRDVGWIFRVTPYRMFQRVKISIRACGEDKLRKKEKVNGN